MEAKNKLQTTGQNNNDMSYIDSQPMRVSINNQPPQTVIRRIHLVHVKFDSDSQELQKLISEGAEILISYEVEHHRDFLLQQIVPTKVQTTK